MRLYSVVGFTCSGINDSIFIQWIRNPEGTTKHTKYTKGIELGYAHMFYDRGYLSHIRLQSIRPEYFPIPPRCVPEVHGRWHCTDWAVGCGFKCDEIKT